MDSLKRPLRVPPDFSLYAEQHGIFELYGRMLEELLISKPIDPLTFLVQYLGRQDLAVPKVIVYGPPASGQNTVSKLTARKLKAVHIQPQRIVNEDKTAQGKEARVLQKAGKDLPPALWANLLSSRLSQNDCNNKGWVIEGFPRTREQALALQAKGILAKHFVHLEAPDNALIERYAGKRVDSLTGDVYHIVFNPPKNEETASRLVEEPGGIEVNMHAKLILYHRFSRDLISCYTSITKSFNADQPLKDLFGQVNTFLCTKPRSASPHTPRILLLGPIGSGKSLQALHLARTYNLVSLDCQDLIKKALTSGSGIADKMKPFHERGVLIPDDMVMSLLSMRLSQLDCASRGWVLHGFPLTRDQAELLQKEGHGPNRVFFLNIPEDSVKERLTPRRMDPLTGERYHMIFKPPQSQEVKERLIVVSFGSPKHPRDHDTNITKKLSMYNGHVEDLVEYYPMGQHVNADQDPLTVFECLESMLVNPLPKQPLLACDLKHSGSA